MKRIRFLAYAGQFVAECMPIYPLYAIMFGDRSDLSTAQISQLFMIWIAVALVSEIPTGALADRFSRRSLLVWSRLLQGAAFGIWLFAPSFAGYAIGFAVWGFGYAMASGTFQAYLYDELDSIGERQQFTRIYSRSASMELAGMATAYLGATIIGARQYETLLVLSIVLSVLAAVLAAALPREKHQTPVGLTSTGALLEAIKEVKGSPMLVRRVANLAAITAVVATGMEFVTIYYRDNGVTIGAIPPLLVVGLVVSSALAWVAHKLERVPVTHVLGLSAVMGVFLIATSFGGMVVAVAGMFLFMRVALLSATVHEAALQHSVVGRSRATIGSIPQFVSEIVALLLVGMFGIVSSATDDFGAMRAFGGATIVMALGLLLLWRTHKPAPGDSDPA